MMEAKENKCRLCLNEDEFNIPIFGLYSRKIKLPEKIKFCLRLSVSEGDCLKYACYSCVHSIVNFYSFLKTVNNSQLKILHDQESNCRAKPTGQVLHLNSHMSKRLETVKNDDYDFSFLDSSDIEIQKGQRLQDKYLEQKSSSFSFFSDCQTNNIVNLNIKGKPIEQDLEFIPVQKNEEFGPSHVFGNFGRNRAFTPKSRANENSKDYNKYIYPSKVPYWRKSVKQSAVIPNDELHNAVDELHNAAYEYDEFSLPRQSRQLSRDLFESQSQDYFNDKGTLDWQLTPGEGVIKRIRSSLLKKITDSFERYL